MKNSESRRTYQGLPKLLSRWYRQHGSQLFIKLQASVAIASILSAYVPLPAMAQQAPPAAANAAPPAPGLPPAPVPNYTQPLSMHTGNRDFSKPHQVFPNYLKTWEPITVAAPVTSNSQRLEALVHNGKIYLSLADAIVLGLENNFDIAIQRYNLDIADTELLRARAGSGLLGVPAGLVQGTQGGTGNTSSSLTSGGGPAAVNAGLSGLHSVVADFGGPLMTRSQSGTPASAMDLNFGGASEFQLAEVSGFYWANFIHTFASDILSATDLVALPTNVNINSSCNAFWNGSSINFFRAGGGCPNTAYSDVILHEYGHGIDSSKGGILDGGYSEGFGDSMAILGTRQSCVGRDFFGAGTCLRPATDVDLWPPPPFSDVHFIGKRYMQFVWQLVQELKKNNSEDESFQIAAHLDLAEAAANPISIPDAVRLSFIADDDDGDLSNGTPHCTELAAAADSRNIPRPPCPPKKMAYAWANSPSAASYTPSVAYSYNSAGGPITITRSGQGTYAVRFAGFGGNGIVGGNVQLTPYGPGHEHCRVHNWSSGGPDFIVNVTCSNTLGVADDTRFTVLVNWCGSPKASRVFHR